MASALGLVKAARPRQWLKNVLVVAAPLASADLVRLDIWSKVGLALLTFCLAASAVYLVNDVRAVAEDRGAKIRRSLERYSASYLRFVWTLSAAVLIMSYGLWAFEIRAAHHNSVWSVISIVPFVVAVLRYTVDVDGGHGGEPEEIALADRVPQVLAVLWLRTLVAAVY